MNDQYNQLLVECTHLEDEVEDAIFHGDLDKLREMQERLFDARSDLYAIKFEQSPA